MEQKGERTDMVDVFMKSRKNKKGETSPKTALVIVSIKIMVYTSITIRYIF